MESTVKINGNCQLVAMPVEDYNVLDKVFNPCMDDSDATMYLEFVLNPKINADSTLRLAQKHHYYYFDLPEDGLYVYYKLKIFNGRYIDDDYDGLYYNPIKQVLMFQGKKLQSILDVLSYLDQGGQVIEYIKIPVFSICKLQNCLKELQKKTLTSCNKGLCDQFTSDKQMRDFLFISIYVLENLIEEERFGEASDILKSISSCVPICKNISLTPGCNCK